MPLLLDTLRPGPAVDLRGRNCLTIGLVNNMPDAACEATERQFIELLRAAANEVVVLLKFFSIPAVPRSEVTRAEIANRYRDLSELWNAPLDGLIITGTEPVAADLKDEPYWNALCDLVDWACHSTISAVWSCLAAHAAVQYADGIVRERLADKLSGVFDCELSGDHPLFADVAPRWCVPHSRLNDLSEAGLVASGYRVLSGSAAAGVDTFVKEQDGGSLFVLFQGHPEYDTDSLLREYRRDVGRFLRGAAGSYPRAPQNYFGSAAAFLADDFRTRAEGGPRSDLIGEFPMRGLHAGIQNTWHPDAIAVYRNWIKYLKEQKSRRRSPAARAQRVSARPQHRRSRSMSAAAVSFAAPADVDLVDNPINPDWIIEGNPQARARRLAESADGTSSVMAWSCTPGRFEWHYAVDETVHIISGEVLVTDENGRIHRLGPGDMAFFPAGSHSIWQVTKTVRKLAVCRHSMPRPAGFVLRAWNKIVHRLTGFPTGSGLGEGSAPSAAAPKVAAA